MIRRLFTAASGVSLLLCLATAVVWTRSLRVGDAFEWTTIHGGLQAIVVARGRFLVYRLDDDRNTTIAIYLHRPTRPVDPATALPPNSDGFTLPVGGIAYAGGWLGTRRFHYLLLPAWLVCGLTALLPGWWLASQRVTRRQRTRREHNLCLTCGYDLRASTGRCPECGTAIKSDVAAGGHAPAGSQD